MLKIRPEQLVVFQPVAEIAFARKIVELLQEKYSSVAIQLPNGITTIAQLPRELLLQMVQTGIVRARKYGFEWESTIGAFVTLMFVAAPNFDDHPLILRILKDEKIPVHTRINELWSKTTEPNWEAVKQRYDANAWRLKLEE
ncbi:MAG: hypothetical protein AB1489_01935 [Acidobacteriota bacterium]